jgi:hypothetical protein
VCCWRCTREPPTFSLLEAHRFQELLELELLGLLELELLELLELPLNPAQQHLQR